ncbi:MAG: phosphatidate cytidylyltransferase [Magnetovibrio sp.]|nr:phosphatidate cytidylyltransferase [Magnetovibrio sp.]
MAQQETDKIPSDLGIRLVSASLLLPPVLLAIFFGRPFFEILILIACAILVFELYRTCNGNAFWTITGSIYMALAVICVIKLRASGNHGIITIYWLFGLVWFADIFAYFVGRKVGGPKIAPTLSPQKTWAGFLGALIGASIMGFLVAIYLGKENLWQLTFFSATLGAVSQAGDLLESWFKRRFGKKDMGSILPGHGGLFDRVDGLLAASIVCWLGQEISGEVLLVWL